MSAPPWVIATPRDAAPEGCERVWLRRNDAETWQGTVGISYVHTSELDSLFPPQPGARRHYVEHLLGFEEGKRSARVRDTLLELGGEP